uniref:Uncharacterized protein n=1 Tax=Trichogramma kaykai TaxID=54128 RepID=A0ABD2X9P0_9HYME
MRKFTALRGSGLMSWDIFAHHREPLAARKRIFLRVSSRRARIFLARKGRERKNNGKWAWGNLLGRTPASMSRATTHLGMCTRAVMRKPGKGNKEEGREAAVNYNSTYAKPHEKVRKYKCGVAVAVLAYSSTALLPERSLLV